MRRSFLLGGMMLAVASVAAADEVKQNGACCDPCAKTTAPTVCRTEMQTVTVTEYVPQTQEVAFRKWRHVPEIGAVLEKSIVLEPEVRTRTESFVVLKPVTRTIQEQVTVLVPHQETRTETRQAIKSVPPTLRRISNRRDVEPVKEICVEEPYEVTTTVMRPETRLVSRTVTELVPQTETREVSTVVQVPKEVIREREFETLAFKPFVETTKVTVNVPVQVQKQVPVQVCEKVAPAKM